MIHRNAIKFSFCAILLSIFAVGCARTVTTVVTFGTQMKVSVTYRDTIDLANDNRYYLVFSSREAFTIPLPPPDSMDEFLEPGDTPQTGNVQDYYTKYYSSWDGYVVLDKTGYYFAKGPFVYGGTATREVLAPLPEVSEKITFNLRLDQIFGSAVPDTIYFDVISVNYPNGALKYIKDHVAPPKPSISKVTASRIAESRDQNLTIDAGLDIIKWAVEIQ